MPELTGFSHVSLSVHDRDASVDWYARVLDFQTVVADMDQDAWKRTICMHPSGVVVGFTQHHDMAPGPFDHRSVGADHLAFSVASRDELDAWQRHFADLGVTHSPVVETDLGAVLSFRDPDGMQLELFYLAL